MKTYNFTLVLGPSPQIDEEIANKLFEAGCDDTLVGMRYGVSIMEFDREAASFCVAVMSAIEDVKRADSRLHVCRIEPEDLVSMSEIARRCDRSRESIRQLVIGRRGPRNFPSPIHGVATKSPLWSWAQVAPWLADHNKLDRKVAERSQEILELNRDLEQQAKKTEVSTAFIFVPYVIPQTKEWDIRFNKPRLSVTRR